MTQRRLRSRAHFHSSAISDWGQPAFDSESRETHVLTNNLFVSQKFNNPGQGAGVFDATESSIDHFQSLALTSAEDEIGLEPVDDGWDYLLLEQRTCKLKVSLGVYPAVGGLRVYLREYSS